jgi:hypothetical protein
MTYGPLHGEWRDLKTHSLLVSTGGCVGMDQKLVVDPFDANFEFISGILGKGGNEAYLTNPPTRSCFFCCRRRKRKITPAIAARTAIPPTVPPAIALVFFFLSSPVAAALPVACPDVSVADGVAFPAAPGGVSVFELLAVGDAPCDETPPESEVVVVGFADIGLKLTPVYTT